jgi:cytoskeletal protein RodZ
MDNQPETRGLAIRRAAIVITALIIVGSFIWLAFFRHKPQTASLRNGQITTSDTQSKNSSNASKSTPSGVSTQSQPTANKTSTTSPSKLVDTGPGDTIFIISSASAVIGTGIHMVYSKRRAHLRRVVYQRITD